MTERKRQAKGLERLVAGKTREELERMRELIAREEGIIAREEERERKEAEGSGKPAREVVASKATGNGTYQWEMVKGYGPYLYRRGVKNDPPSKKHPNGRKSIYIPLKDVHQHPDAPPRP